MSKGLLCYYPKVAWRSRWIIPVSLRTMLLNYFRDSVFSGHLGALKNFQKIAGNFYWPKMWAEILDYIHRSDLCQRLKPAQNTRVVLHSATPFSENMERFFIDFMGPSTRSKWGNVVILVVFDSFSKFVSFFHVRKISYQVVCDCLQRALFPACGTPVSIVTENAKVFLCKQIKDLCFRWGITHITTTRGESQSEFEICAEDIPLRTPGHVEWRSALA
jgi:hypothetical protein